MKRITGSYKKLGNTDFFTPFDLPPHDPPFEMTPELTELYGQTMLNLGKINEISSRIPDTKRFIKSYVIKEALLSSEIENIHTTVLDVFTQSISSVDAESKKNTQLVINYITALEDAVFQIQSGQAPIANRLLMRAHELLMGGTQADAGSYRRHSVRVGNLIPPQPQDIPELMNNLENFINSDSDDLPPLIKAGLVHVQFETIHPFSDGNGRIGRLLILLMLIEDGLINAPIIYPSYYFKKNRSEYYTRLDAVRINGDFEGWILYYMTALNKSCIDACQRAQKIEELERNVQQKIENYPDFGRTKKQAKHALEILFQSPVISVSELAQRLDVSFNTADAIIKKYSAIGVLHDLFEKKRNRLFYFKDYIDVLEVEL